MDCDDGCGLDCEECRDEVACKGSEAYGLPGGCA